MYVNLLLYILNYLALNPGSKFVEPGFEANNYHDGQKFALKVLHVRAIEPYVKIHRLIAHGCQED